MFEFIKNSKLTADWKTKAKHRRIENKKLKKQINQLKDSRDKWQTIAADYKQQMDAYKKKKIL